MSHYMLMCTYAHDTLFMYTCACLYTPLDFIYVLVGLLSDNSGPAYPDLGAWSLWILHVADQISATEAWNHQ